MKSFSFFISFLISWIYFNKSIVDQFFSFLRKKHILFLYFDVVVPIAIWQVMSQWRWHVSLTEISKFSHPRKPSEFHIARQLATIIHHFVSHTTWTFEHLIHREKFHESLNVESTFEIVFFLSFVFFFFFSQDFSKFPRQRMEKNRPSNGVESRDLERGKKFSIPVSG